MTELQAVWPGSQPLKQLEPHADWIAVSKAINGNESNLCFLDVGSGPEAAFRVMDGLREARIPVIALHTTNDPELILNSLRRGAVEFLASPLTREQVSRALARIDRKRAHESGAGAPPGKIYCFMPGKGACGSTTLACNIAFDIQRARDHKVLLADLDPLTGTISFLLKLRSNYSFVHAVTNAARMDDDLWRGLITSFRGVDILLAPESPVELVNEAQELPALTRFWRERYGAVILDAPGRYRPWGTKLAKCCDELVLVTTNELPAIRATHNALAHLARAGVEDSRIKLVVNRYNPMIGINEQAIEETLNRPIFHMVPSDYDSVQKALMQGKPVPGGTRVGRSIALLAEKLAGGTPQKPKPSRFPALRELLSRV